MKLLSDYFKGRKVWWLETYASPPQLRPYPVSVIGPGSQDRCGLLATARGLARITASAAILLLYSTQVIRQVIQRLSRGLVLKRHLPPEFGGVPLLVSPEAALAYWRRDVSKVDPLLLSIARELVEPNMTVWDIGANVGLFSFAAAALGASVVAVEADPFLANLISRSALVNRLPVTALAAAVSDKLGVSTLHFSERGRSSSSLGGNGSGQAVVTVTLDWLLDRFSAPHVLKIDVEGMEFAVLTGGARVLGARPRIFAKSPNNTTQSQNCLRRQIMNSSPLARLIANLCNGRRGIPLP